MKCPRCGFQDSKVIDSRPTENGSNIRRRRECLNCHTRFTTFECYEISETKPMVVVKKDGTLEIFDKNKIIAGLIKSCYKRPVTTDQINEAADEIEATLKNSLRTEFQSSEIGKMVMESLKKLDEVAYVRFASVYREFKDVETFMEEIHQLKNIRDSADEDDEFDN